jgi:hypothetical protein
MHFSSSPCALHDPPILSSLIFLHLILFCDEFILWTSFETVHWYSLHCHSHVWVSKRPLGRPGCRWEDNIKLDLKEIGIDGVNWIQLARDRDQRRAFLKTVMNLWVPYKAGNFLTSWVTISFWRRTLLRGVSYIVCVTLRYVTLRCVVSVSLLQLGFVSKFLHIKPTHSLNWIFRMKCE